MQSCNAGILPIAGYFCWHVNSKWTDGQICAGALVIWIGSRQPYLLSRCYALSCLHGTAIGLPTNIELLASYGTECQVKRLFFFSLYKNSFIAVGVPVDTMAAVQNVRTFTGVYVK